MVNSRDDRNADAARHLHVVDAGADHGAEPRALHQEVERDRGDERDAEHDEPVGREGEARNSAAAARNSAGAGSGIGSPVQISRHRSAMMKEMPSVTSTWPCALPASWRRTKRSSMMPTRPTPRPAPSAASQKLNFSAEQRVAEIGAEHEERAMREVGNAHQPEDQREAGRQQEQQAAERDAVQRLDDPELH